MGSMIGDGPDDLSHREVVETISALLLGGNDTVPNQLSQRDLPAAARARHLGGDRRGPVADPG